MATEEKWVYTPWGYGKISERNRSKAIVHMSWGGTAYLNPSSLSPSIHFSIKLFSSGRKTLQFEWSILQDFSLLYSQVQKQLALSPNIQLNLYYSKGKLLKLLPTDSPLKLKLKSHIKFIGITKQNFIWDSLKKSQNIELLDDLLSVRKKDDTDVSFESVLGTICMTNGVYQWEIRFDFITDYEEEEEIFIGVAGKNIELSRSPMELEYWGIMSLAAQKFCQGVHEDYGEGASTGDVIGVRLEFKDSKGTLSFSKNGVSLGNAFCDVPPGVHPVVSLNYPKIQVSLGKSAGM